MARFLSAGFGRSAFETARRLFAHLANAERLIGSIRRECIDHVVVFGERHLRYVLLSYKDYYNAMRTHLSLNKDDPLAALSGPGISSAARFWVDCTINMAGCDLR